MSASAQPKARRATGTSVDVIATGGGLFEGDVVGDLPQGKGRVQWPKRRGSSVSCSGDFVAGIAQGECQYEVLEGCTFVGKMERNRRSFGSQQLLRGAAVVEGQFQTDNDAQASPARRKISLPQMSFSCSSNFQGDVPDGDSVVEYQDVKVEGTARNGKLSGRGSVSWVSGDQYEGSYENNRRQGRGSYSWSNGCIYDGEFHHGQPHGQGTLSWSASSTYKSFSGMFQRGQRHGWGTLTYRDGSIDEGDWRGRVLLQTSQPLLQRKKISVDKRPVKTKKPQKQQPGADRAERTGLLTQKSLSYLQAVACQDQVALEDFVDEDVIHPDVRDSAGICALHLAVAKAQTDLLDWLVSEANADIDRLDAKDIHALTLALFLRNDCHGVLSSPTVDYLQTNDTLPATTTKANAYLDILCKALDLGGSISQAHTPMGLLPAACALGDVEAVKEILLRRPAAVSGLGSQGTTEDVTESGDATDATAGVDLLNRPLWCCVARMTGQEPESSQCRELLGIPAKPNVADLKSVALLLIQNGADVLVHNQDGVCLLELIAATGDVDISSAATKALAKSHGTASDDDRLVKATIKALCRALLDGKMEVAVQISQALPELQNEPNSSRLAINDPSVRSAVLHVAGRDNMSTQEKVPIIEALMESGFDGCYAVNKATIVDSLHESDDTVEAADAFRRLKSRLTIVLCDLAREYLSGTSPQQPPKLCANCMRCQKRRLQPCPRLKVLYFCSDHCRVKAQCGSFKELYAQRRGSKAGTHTVVTTSWSPKTPTGGQYTGDADS